MTWRVLVVDDDVVVAMRLSFSDEDVEVTDVGRMADALPAALAGVFDVAIVDRRLPDGDGLDLVRQLRNRAETADLPIIVLTAWHDEADRPEVIDSGASEYLAKPVEPDALVDIFRRLTGVADDDARAEKKARRRGRLRHRRTPPTDVTPADSPAAPADQVPTPPGPSVPADLPLPPLAAEVAPIDVMAEIEALVAQLADVTAKLATQDVELAAGATERARMAADAVAVFSELVTTRDALTELRAFAQDQEIADVALREHLRRAEAAIVELKGQLADAQTTIIELRHEVARTPDPSVDRSQTVIDLRDATQRLVERTRQHE